MNNSSSNPKQKLDINDSSIKDTQIAQADSNVFQTKNSGNKLIQIFQKPNNWIVGTLVALVGIVGIVFSNNNNQSTQINGNVGSGAVIGTYKNIQNLTISPGDSPEVKQQKLEKAKRLIADTVLDNIVKIDNRLDYIKASFSEDDFEEKLRKTRQQVAPAAEKIFSSGYRQLITQEQVTSLQQKFNSQRLNTENGRLLIQVLLDGEANAETVINLYNQLAEVEDASESLFRDLSKTASNELDDKELVAHNQRKVQLAVDKLQNRSQIAYLSGLMVLNSLDIELPNADGKLTALNHLEPRRLIDEREITLNNSKYLEEAKKLIAERKAIINEAELLRDNALKKYKQINEELQIQPTDTWNIVVAKAISLRQLGRTSEAVAGFSKYREMFAASDPTALLYAKTAQQFTLQLQDLGLEGGVYIYEIIDGSAAIKAGLNVGDIVISHGTTTIKNMNDLTSALQNSPKGEPVKITYLHMQPDGQFIRKTTTVVGKPLGAGFMPI